jgi:hypothetical protein
MQENIFPLMEHLEHVKKKKVNNEQDTNSVAEIAFDTYSCDQMDSIQSQT